MRLTLGDDGNVTVVRMAVADKIATSLSC